MHPPRLRAFSYVGKYAYFLTLCTHQRCPRFASADVAMSTLTQFRESAMAFAFEITAYCVMPDHAHLLCTALSDASDLIAFVGDAKQQSAYRSSKSIGGRLWQKGFYDHVLRDDDQTLAVVRYIVANPVRAGLANGIGEYPFCGSDAYSMQEIAECQEMWTPLSRRERRGQP